MGFLGLIYVFRSEADKQSPFPTNEVGDWIIDIEIDRYARYGSQVLYLRNQILRYLINYWFVIADILRRIFLLLMFSLFISMVSLLRGITIISKRLPRSTTSYSTDWPFQSEYICVTPDPYIGIALHRPRKKGRERREDKTKRLQAKEIWIWNPDLTGRRTALHVSGK